jgi:hypothetical protein
LSEVTILEAGDFGYDVSSGERGRVVLENCRADLAYNPIFNLTRGAIPVDAQYEVTILSPAEGTEPTPRTGLGVITGEKCTFLIHDGTSRPLPEKHRDLLCGGRYGLRYSTIINETDARLILDERVVDCEIRSRGPVENRGSGNDIKRIP